MNTPVPVPPAALENLCGGEPTYPGVAAGALAHNPPLVKVSSFGPQMTGPDIFNQTANLGSYTVNCGAPCWIVDEREVWQAALDATAGAVVGLGATLMFGTLGMLMGSVGSILCWISCCIACMSEEPDEREPRGEKLMAEDGDDV